MQIKTLVSDTFEENTYLLIYEKELVIIDPGASIMEIQSMVSNLKSRIKYTLLTHGHYDHIIAAMALSAPIYAHEKEKAMLEDPDINLSAKVFLKPSLSLKNVNYFKGAHYKLDEFEIFHTPGHTAGGVVIKTGNDLFTGDTLFFDSVGRTDTPTGDSKALKASLKVFEAFDRDIMCYPGHGEPFKLGNAYETNFYLKR